jgi:hypothetical protein
MHIGEIDVERDQRASLVLAEAIDPRIVGAAEPLLADADRVAAGAVEQSAGLARQPPRSGFDAWRACEGAAGPRHRTRSSWCPVGQKVQFGDTDD